MKWQDGHHHILADVINKITATSPVVNKKQTQAFLGIVRFWRMHMAGYRQHVSPLYQGWMGPVVLWESIKDEKLLCGVPSDKLQKLLKGTFNHISVHK